MLTSALLAVSSLRVTQQQGLFPHTTATTSGAAEASTPVAVMLVGAANDMNISDMQRLAEFVVEPMAPAEVFILIKAIHHNRSWYSPEDTEQLRRNVQQYLRPTSSSIEAADLPLERFRNASNATTDCLYPMSGRQYVLESERRTLQSRFAYWWGALDLAWDLVAERERTRGSVFETIVFVRPDLNFLGPIRRPEDVQRGVWYSPVEPPDGFWILPRTAASRAMKTASLMERCARTSTCCQAMNAFQGCRGGGSQPIFSWYLPCYWGIPTVSAVATDLQVRITVETHEAKNGDLLVWDPTGALQSEHSYRSDEWTANCWGGLASLYEDGNSMSMTFEAPVPSTCFWHHLVEG